MGGARAGILWAIGLSACAGLLFYFYRSWATGESILGFDPSPANVDEQGEVPVGQVLLAGGAMVLGILFGAVHSALTRVPSDKPLPPWMVLINLREALGAFLVSPIVFGGVYTLTKQQPDRILALLFAFENGFFCQALFRKRADATGS